MNRFWISFFVLFIFISACKDNIGTINELANKCSSGDKKACNKLAEIAKTEKNSDIRKSAIKNLSDQMVLAFIAINDKDFNIRKVAVETLTDLSILAEIALEDVDVGISAFMKLENTASIGRTHLDAEDWRLRLIYKFMAAFDTVPPEYRYPHTVELFPVLRVLSNPDIITEVGEIETINTEWESTSQYYPGGRSGTKPGEIFRCSIKFQKLIEPISYTWETNFSSAVTSLSFKSADVYPSDLLKKLLEKIDNQEVAYLIAKKNKDCRFRMIAIEMINDQMFLSDIAKNDEDSYVRIAAADKLIDKTVAQSVFSDIYKKETTNHIVDHSVIKKVVEKITDQTVLAIIANNYNSDDIRIAAAEKLNDQNIAQSVFAEIAKSSTSGDVRLAVAEKLLDQSIVQSVLADIAKNDIYVFYRERAIEMLTDQKLLTDLAKNDKNAEVRWVAELRLKELQKE